jgi:hypothetical protein
MPPWRRVWGLSACGAGDGAESGAVGAEMNPQHHVLAQRIPALHLAGEIAPTPVDCKIWYAPIAVGVMAARESGAGEVGHAGTPRWRVVAGDWGTNHASTPQPGANLSAAGAAVFVGWSDTEVDACCREIHSGGRARDICCCITAWVSACIVFFRN